MLTLIPAAAMFLRGDVKPAQLLVAATLDRERELEVLRHSSPWELAHAGHVGELPRFRHPSRAAYVFGAERLSVVVVCDAE